MTDKEKEVLQDALHGEAGYGFSDEKNNIAQGLVYKGYLKRGRRGPSPFHDNFNITRQGRA